jgi:hypothetical protein
MNNAMHRTVTLVAEAKYGSEGKQYIARITGRHPKFTFAREFVGQKTGKRRDFAEYMTDEPGLYMTCDIDKKGNKDETFWIVYDLPGSGLLKAATTKEIAMMLAKRIGSDPIDWAREALMSRLAYHESLDQDRLVVFNSPQFGIGIGEHKRSVVVEALKATLATLAEKVRP